jgi:hypothetical protein
VKMHPSADTTTMKSSSRMTCIASLSTPFMMLHFLSPWLLLCISAKMISNDHIFQVVMAFGNCFYSRIDRSGALTRFL